MDSGYGYGDSHYGRAMNLGAVQWSNFDNVQFFQPSDSEFEDQGNQGKHASGIRSHTDSLTEL